MIGQVKIVTHPSPHLVYLSGRGGELVAQQLGFGAHWTHNASIGVTRDMLEKTIKREAEHDAEQAQKYGGNASVYWLASDAEAMTRGLDSALRMPLNDLYLNTFRAKVKAA